MKEVPKLFERKELCCGCTACYAVCSVNAITMNPDEEGFDYPEIDKNKCILCEKCISVCPIRVKEQ